MINWSFLYYNICCLCIYPSSFIVSGSGVSVRNLPNKKTGKRDVIEYVTFFDPQVAFSYRCSICKQVWSPAVFEIMGKHCKRHMQIGRISRKENKLVNQSIYDISYITARPKFHKIIPSSCWDRFTSSDIPQIRATKLFDLIVHWRLWTKVQKYLPICKAPQGLFTMKIWRGLHQKIFGKTQKWQILSEHEFGSISELVNRSRRLRKIARYLIKTAEIVW